VVSFTGFVDQVAFEFPDQVAAAVVDQKSRPAVGPDLEPLPDQLLAYLDAPGGAWTFTPRISENTTCVSGEDGSQ